MIVFEFDLVDNVVIQTNLIEAPVFEFDIMTGGVGPQGPPGPPGGSVVVVEAGENLSTGRVVIMDGGVAMYFQPSDISHAGRAYGVTASSATVGNDVDVQTLGEVIDAAFTFAVDKLLFVDDDGVVTDVPPTTQVLQKAGISVGVDRMKIDFSTQAIF